MENSSSDFLGRETSRIIQEVRYDQDYINFLGWEINSILRDTKAPTVTPVELIEHQGQKAGYLPPPAKRIIAKEALTGQASSPLRVLYEERQGDPQKIIDRLSLHLITLITPRTRFNRKEIALFVKSLLGLKEFLGQVTYNGDEDNLDTVVANCRATVHIVRRGAFGNYRVIKISIEKPNDIQTTIQTYGKSLNESLSFFSDDNLGTPVIVNEVIGQEILEEVQQDQRQKNSLSIPILFSPPSEYSAVLQEQTSIAKVFKDSGNPTIILSDQEGKIKNGEIYLERIGYEEK